MHSRFRTRRLWAASMGAIAVFAALLPAPPAATPDNSEGAPFDGTYVVQEAEPLAEIPQCAADATTGDVSAKVVAHPDTTTPSPLPGGSEPAATLQAARELTSSALTVLRRMGRGLTTSALDERGVVGALQVVVQERDPPARLIVSGGRDVIRVDQEIERALFYATVSVTRELAGRRLDLEVKPTSSHLSVIIRMLHGDAPTRSDLVADRLALVGGEVIAERGEVALRVPLNIVAA